MMSETRVPKAEITGAYEATLKCFSKKMLGDVAEPAEVMWHNRDVLRDVTGFGRKVNGCHECDPEPEIVRAYGGRVVDRL